jgi:hypothetical protein
VCLASQVEHFGKIGGFGNVLVNADVVWIRCHGFKKNIYFLKDILCECVLEIL